MQLRHPSPDSCQRRHLSAESDPRLREPSGAGEARYTGAARSSRRIGCPAGRRFRPHGRTGPHRIHSLCDHHTPPADPSVRAQYTSGRPFRSIPAVDARPGTCETSASARHTTRGPLMPAQGVIYTIGHSNRSLDAFLGLLIQHGCSWWRTCAPAPSAASPTSTATAGAGACGARYRLRLARARAWRAPGRHELRGLPADRRLRASLAHLEELVASAHSRPLRRGPAGQVPPPAHQPRGSAARLEVRHIISAMRPGPTLRALSFSSARSPHVAAEVQLC